jgi:DNA-binding GntR family transcriptional regulator
MSSPDEIRRSVIADAIKSRLLEGIMSGDYPPGTRIVETRLAREFDVSQAPVREALRGLEALGFVEIAPFRGARVRELSAEELMEAYVVRSELEALGARLAMRRMTQANLTELLQYGQKMRDAAHAGDRQGVAVADASFHGCLIQMAGNGTLERLWRSLEPFSRTLISLVAPGADPQWSASLHEPILDALQAHDTRAVVRAIRRHFAEASSNLACRLGEGLPGSASGRGDRAKIPSSRGPSPSSAEG